jgi:hypothetical protein
LPLLMPLIFDIIIDYDDIIDTLILLHYWCHWYIITPLRHWYYYYYWYYSLLFIIDIDTILDIRLLLLIIDYYWLTLIFTAPLPLLCHYIDIDTLLLLMISIDIRHELLIYHILHSLRHYAIITDYAIISHYYAIITPLRHWHFHYAIIFITPLLNIDTLLLLQLTLMPLRHITHIAITLRWARH